MVKDKLSKMQKINKKVVSPYVLLKKCTEPDCFWFLRYNNHACFIKFYVYMSLTCQYSAEVAGSSSGGSEGPWSIRSLFLKCSATPTIERGKTALNSDISE